MLARHDRNDDFGAEVQTLLDLTSSSTFSLIADEGWEVGPVTTDNS